MRASIDVTTILLVDNNNRAAHGRFLNVKPAVGLLTSTARTFIQEGVTTEYATQVLGTTLDNGRLYAQLLTKSSRVLYNNNDNSNGGSDAINPSATVSSIAFSHIVSTRLIGGGSLEDGTDDDQNVVTFIKNTDDVSPTNPTRAYVVLPSAAQYSRNLSQGQGTEVEYIEFLPQSLAQVRENPSEHPNGEIRQSFSVSESSSSSSSSGGGGGGGSDGSSVQESLKKVKPDKVKPANDLPTFTVKNDFAPSGFSFDGPGVDIYQPASLSELTAEQNLDESSKERSFSGSPQAVDTQQNRIGKQLQPDLRHLTSVTYYGFADFTTIVGNTVIVFSPNTAPVATGQITSITGEATLHPASVTPTSTNAFEIKPTATVTVVEEEQLHTKKVTQNAQNVVIVDDKLDTTTAAATEPTSTEADTQEPSTTHREISEEEQSQEELEQKSSVLAKEQNSLKYESMSSVSHVDATLLASTEFLEPSEAPSVSTSVSASSSTATQPVMLSIPSSEDIAKIFASLQAQAALQQPAAQSTPSSSSSSSSAEEATIETRVSGGATTIFFEDDPFLLLASTTSASIESAIEPSATIITAATVTAVTAIPSVDDEKESESTTTDGPIAETTTIEANESDTVTTSNIDESTTAQPNETNEHEEEQVLEADIDCPNGFVPKPSTVYKTLTYLTTFFIPTDDDESTTTSIQSNDVVQTDISFECLRTQQVLEIEATSTLAADTQVKPSKSFGAAKQPSTTTEAAATTTGQQSKEAIVKANLRNKLFNRFKGTTASTTTTEEPVVIDAQQKGEDEPIADTTTSQDEGENSTVEAVTMSVSSTTTESIDVDADEPEIELIYKTLYTTYTYLTTFFHESTSSVSSRKEVVTNIVTSTLDMSQLKSDPAFADLVASMSAAGDIDSIESNIIRPTAVANAGAGARTTVAATIEKEAISIEDIFDGSIVGSGNSHQSTPVLDGAVSLDGPDAKTYYTTYTYFTTIFVDGETEISSRTEVYTNFVGQSIKPTNLVEEDKLFATSAAIATNEARSNADDLLDNNIISPKYSTMSRADVSTVELRAGVPYDELKGTTVAAPVDGASSGVVMSVSQTNSTRSSATEQQPPPPQSNNLLEDQISSESNNDEILPAKLLLQTSYTTFTYFTTQYVGSTSEILSRLETITNVVTETLAPTQTVNVITASAAPAFEEDAGPLASGLLPTTYFTTFTYWTTLYKEGDVVTTSREEIVSNVVQPTAVASLASGEAATTTAMPVNINEPDVVLVSAIQSLANVAIVTPASVRRPAEAKTKLVGAVVDDDEIIGSTETISLEATPVVAALEPTTYFTTYTYYTTSYIGDETVLNSRFETITNVITATPVAPATASASTVAVGRAINLDKSNPNQIVDEKFDKKQKVKDLGAAAPPPADNVLSLNVGKIVDAEGISTIFFTTRAVATHIGDLYTQVTEKTSSISVDESKKAAAAATKTGNSEADRHKVVGLVRLIDGTMIANRTTTLYQSKVIGTFIDNRYAQIIESTSSYVIEKTREANIAPTATTQGVQATAKPAAISPTSAVLESSINEGEDHREDGDDDGEGDEDGNGEEGGEEGDDEADENGRKKSRLTFSTRKRTFTPVIRPFASRNRPTFNPKRKNLSPSSATIITRSDFTPTITATPAIKSEGSSRRFSGPGRRSSVNNPAAAASSIAAASGGSSSSSSRRFSRLRTSAPNSVGGGAPSSIGSSRIIRPSSVRLQSTPAFGGSSRRANNLFRSSTLGGSRLSILPSQARFRPNPSLASAFRDSQASQTVKPSADPSQDDSTTVEPVDDDENAEDFDDEDAAVTSTTTENSRRNANPLLRLRRPGLGSGNGAAARFQPSSTPRPVFTISTRRSPLLRGRTSTAATTTTTTTPKPKRTFQKPSASLAALTNRPRASNSLFPPRGLFKPTAAANQDLEKDDENNKVTNDAGEGQTATDGEGEEDSPAGTDDAANGDDAVGYADGGEAEVADDVDDNRNRRENKSSAAQSPKDALAKLLRKRTKRQVDYGARSLSRYRRPKSQQITNRSYDDEVPDIEYAEVPTQRPRASTSRYAPRNRGSVTANNAGLNQQTNSRIRPTKSTPLQNRAQFTLRSGAANANTDHRDSGSYSPINSRTSNFRRGNNAAVSPYGQSASNRRKPLPTSSPRAKSSRSRTYGAPATESRSNFSRSRNNAVATGRGRTQTTRGRGRVQPDTYDYISNFDGTITVTHQVPTEITIPVVNGHNTEYKNIITAKISTEILGPDQYSTTTRGLNGNSVLILTSEHTNLNNAGATELTQFFLRETPTTSVTFTPTVIRGRKTSFSHIVPSTVYNVEAVTSTVQPQISANAPLANILLSQLLLGNLGLPNQQQALLAGLGQQQQLAGLGQQQQLGLANNAPQTPTTEFKTRTTTYVTTVTNAMSTVIPLTFRGKEILTTIVESSVNVITATEFLTDTIVVTPTQALQQPQQFNSLLLPLLLQQQQQQLNAAAPLANVLANTAAPSLPGGLGIDSLSDSLLGLDADDLPLTKKPLEIQDDNRAEDYADSEAYENEPPQVKSFARQQALSNLRRYNKPPAPTPALETSVITLYVSGRKPGEFSTVLSTVISSGSSLLQKRAVHRDDFAIPAKASALPELFDFYNAEGSDIDMEYMLPTAADATNELNFIESSHGGNERFLGNAIETQSLESILGDVSKYVDLSTAFGSGSTSTFAQQQPEASATNAGVIDESPASPLATSPKQKQQQKSFLY